MGNLVFQATLGGQVNLVGPNTASTYNINVPAIAGTLVTTGDTGTVTNTMLAGSIANAKLLNSSVTIGSTSVSLGSTVTAFAGITTLSMSSDLTLSGGTANGVAYLNGSKVVTTGSALTFDGTNLRLNGGTLAASGYTVQTITAGSGGSILQLGDGTTDLRLQINAAGGVGYFGTYTSATPLSFQIGGSEQMRLTSTGLGIGTSSPANKLDVLSTSFAIARFSRSGAGGSAGIDIVEGSGGYSRLATPGGTSNMSFRPGGTELMLLDSSGNLGLGVTPSATPTGIKSINVGSQGYVFSDGVTYKYNSGITNNAYVNGNNSYAAITSRGASIFELNGDTFIWKQASTGTAGSTLSLTSAMTLDASGNLLVGNTTNGLSNKNSISLEPYSGGAYAVFNHASGTTSGSQYTFFGYNGSSIGSITQSGTTAVLYNLTSDQRLKENIIDAAPASDLIDAIQVRQYDWKSDGSHQRYGFIAQELVAVAPEAVHQPADPEEMMAVDYSKLVPMLVKEIQSLRQRLAAANI